MRLLNNNAKAKRHRCSFCGRQRYANHMVPTSQFSANNRDQRWRCADLCEGTDNKANPAQVTLELLIAEMEGMAK